MKLQIISDLHQEFGITDLNFSNADIIILAGDINIGTRAIKWIKENSFKKPVLYILGNHEYYKGAYPKTLNKIKEEAEGSNIYVLENDSVEINGVVFHGATLWTDFSIFGNAKKYGILCQSKMNDYKRIRINPSYSKLRTIDTYRIHNKTKDWLIKSLEKNKEKPNIVITHHAPSIQSIPEKYKLDSITAAYASNLEDLILNYQPLMWIHGHVHQPIEYKIGETQIICNPHGYIDEPYNGYKKNYIKYIEI